MIIISHRGNISGPNRDRENTPDYIEEAISLGFDVEIDIHLVDGNFYLGHDGPDLLIDLAWLRDRSGKLWIHCKNLAAISWFNGNPGFRYFWHQEDAVTLTSSGDIWAYPGKQPIERSIAVMPEIYGDNLDFCSGVCTDYPVNYVTK